MRVQIRQTYQPAISQTQLRSYHSCGKQLTLHQPPQPISSVTNLKLYLYQTKQKLQRKENSQFCRNDSLVREQIPFFYSPYQKKKENQIKFQAYLDGDIEAEEYLTLQNFNRIYSNIKGIKEEDTESTQTPLEKESLWKKLKERLIFKFQRERRKRSQLSIKTQLNIKDPYQDAATKLKGLIVRKHYNKMATDTNIEMEKQMKKVKMIKEASNAADETKRKLLMNMNMNTQLYSFRAKRQISQSKGIKIINYQSCLTDRSHIERSQELSKFMMQQSVLEQAERILKEENEGIKLLNQSKSNKHIQFNLNKQQQQKSFRTTSIIKQQNNQQKQQEDRSFNSSLNSILEQKINELYVEDTQIKNQIKSNHCESLIKKIKQTQQLHKLHDQILQVNNSKLYKTNLFQQQ